MDSVQPVIVVGVTGSGAAAAALHWAVDEARSRGAALLVIRVWEPTARPAPYAAQESARVWQQRRATASEELRGGLHREFGGQIPDWVAAELAEGSPERVLVQRSAEAVMLVVGATGQPLTPGRPIGPVVRACLSRAGCPVVIVSAPAGQPDPLSSEGVARAAHVSTGMPEPAPAGARRAALTVPQSRYQG
ncbi:MAG: universal stress protein [Streptosporangiaceae bacterium]